METENSTYDLQLDKFFCKIIDSRFSILCFLFDRDWSINCGYNWGERDKFILVSKKIVGEGYELKLEFYVETNQNFKRKMFLIGEYNNQCNKENVTLFVEKYKSVFTEHKTFITPTKGRYYRWLDKSSFASLFPGNTKRLEMSDDNGAWTYLEFMGLIIKNNHYYHRYSDFGSNNYITIVRGDVKFYDMLNKKEVLYFENPAGNGHISLPLGEDNKFVHIDYRFGKAESLSSHSFDYFYNGKLLLLENYDSVFSGKHVKKYDYGYPIYKTDFPSKLFSPPSNLIESSFILTKHFEGEIE